jgi:Zn finger protein HypA/HybF involved in hydrogenase expression
MSDRKRREKGKRRGEKKGAECTCPECGTTIPQKKGTPCVDMICPNCGASMLPS